MLLSVQSSSFPFVSNICFLFADLREFGTKLEKEVLDCETSERKYVIED